MALNLYNTKSRSIEPFSPLNGNTVTMYACGPTVYDKTHIGHLRKYIGDDILRRTLSYLGYEVKHVMNITDVGHLTNDSDEGEDKFEGKAKTEGKTVWDIAKFYTDYFHESMRAVNVLPPNIAEAKATDHISEMIALNEKLVEKGFAYETDQALYFDISKDLHYGELSGQKLSDKLVGAREEVSQDPEKKNPADFALWFKRVGKFAEHSMYWPSPWGDGFPGWHIECSAMSMKYLGETIDIHTGGIDHIPVHHENEIAQSECATGHQFVRFWVHHEFLNVDGEKMSKSKNNFYTIEDIKAKNIDPVAVRLLVMGTSYRKPLNFTWEALKGAQTALSTLYEIFLTLPSSNDKSTFNKEIKKEYRNEFIKCIGDDLNTSKALALMWKLVHDHRVTDKDRRDMLLDFDHVFGFGLSNLKNIPKIIISDEVQTIINNRDLARKDKDFELSDKLRAELERLGYEVSDTPDGTELN